MIRNHWKTNAGKVVHLAVLILATVATTEEIRAQAQTPQRTKMHSTRPTAPTPAPAQTPQRPGTSTTSACLAPRSPECLEVRINELTNRAAALEADLNAIKDLLQRVNEAIEKHGDQKGDLEGAIKSIWQAIEDLRSRVPKKSN